MVSTVVLLGLSVFPAFGGVAREESGEVFDALALLESKSCTACHAPPGAWGALRSEAPARSFEALSEDHLLQGVPALFLGHANGLRLGARQADWVTEGRVETTTVPRAVSVATIETGRQLFHRSGCVACHVPFEDMESLGTPIHRFTRDPVTPAVDRSPSRDALSERFPLDGLVRYLSRGGGEGHRPELPIESGEAQSLAAYLLFEEAVDQGGWFDLAPGVVAEYYEGEFQKEPPFDQLTPTRVGSLATLGLPEHRADRFAVRLRGWLEIESPGEYTFITTSDDGSWLYLDGERVVDNGGLHAPVPRSGSVNLTVGKHAIEVTFFELTGGEELRVEYEGPGTPRQEIPATRLSHMGATFPTRPEGESPRVLNREHFEKAGCSACHPVGGELRALPAQPLSALGGSGAGCLSGELPGDGGRPTFQLPEADRAPLVRALATLAGETSLAPAELLHARLAHEGCLSCHRRDGEGGPATERLPYFEIEGDYDLGDEGRLPPHLDDVGSKLKTEWLREVLTEGARSRPYVKTRMPRFPGREALIALIDEVDHEASDDLEPAFDLAAVEAGRKLVGTKGGLGCIQCHDLAGHPSLGIPAVDLAKVHDRVRPGWFEKLLVDPIAINMNTRMPTFWVDGKSPVTDVYGGDPARQVEAIWTYLSLEDSMPLPAGLLPHATEYEVEVIDRPVTVGVFFEDVSPRTLLVGFPERLHFAYDLQHSRLAKAWRGRFYNGRGTWHGRAGALEKPFGDDVIELPPGAAVARLSRPDAPWPGDTSTGEDYRVLGRRFDDERRPVFRYAVDGVTVEEVGQAKLSVGGARLLRRLRLEATGSPSAGLTLRLARGARIVPEAEGTFLVSGAGDYRVAVAGGSWRVVEVGGAQELRGTLPFDSRGGSFVAEVEAEYSW